MIFFDNHCPLIIAGPCVIESQYVCCAIAERLAEIADGCDAQIVFKGSYDKANRTTGDAYRGVGIDDGLRILSDIRSTYGLQVTTDVHSVSEVKAVGDVVDIIQIPAMLSRQTDLLVAAGKTGKWVNVKKGQFMSPGKVSFAVDKANNDGMTFVTERGSCFGYDRLVVDLQGIATMRSEGYPVVFDASHSSASREMVVPMARAAVAFGVDGLFFEVHTNPVEALCDGKTSISLGDFDDALLELLSIWTI